MATRKRTFKSSDEVILDALMYEFASDNRAETQRKIRRRLRYHDAGPYQQERVDLLRHLKDEIQSEIGRSARSSYFVGSHGRFAAMEDFNIEQMTQDLAVLYPDVPRKVIAAFVPFAVYLYYLR